jgi:hypothetical protein
MIKPIKHSKNVKLVLFVPLAFSSGSAAGRAKTYYA